MWNTWGRRAGNTRNTASSYPSYGNPLFRQCKTGKPKFEVVSPIHIWEKFLRNPSRVVDMVPLPSNCSFHFFFLYISPMFGGVLALHCASAPPLGDLLMRIMGVVQAVISVTAITLLVWTPTSLAHPGWDFPWGGGYSGLLPEYYMYTCPQVNDIVLSVLERAFESEPRIAASLLRLHFHDCFVQGCDASVLLDDSPVIVSEKRAGPNLNSLRGFEVIDEIKAKLEEICPETVSCADILALAARGSTVLSGGPNWELPLGRRDSRTASISIANHDIPPPNSTIQNLVTLFQRQGLDEVDLVALSGGHTLGMARCVTFKQRLYDQNGNNRPDSTLERGYYQELKTVCPRSGGDNNISPLDLASPVMFDNSYYKLILWGKGLLTSDEVLLTGSLSTTMELVKAYAEDEGQFFQQFARSMIKMGSIKPLIGFNGEVRNNCRRVN